MKYLSVAFFGLIFLMSACGNRGPLVMPDQSDVEKISEQNQAIEEQ